MKLDPSHGLTLEPIDKIFISSIILSMPQERVVYMPHELYNGILGERPDGTRVGVATDEQGIVQIDTGYSHATYLPKEVIALGEWAFGYGYAGDNKIGTGLGVLVKTIHEASRDALLPGKVRQLQAEITKALGNVA